MSYIRRTTHLIGVTAENLPFHINLEVLIDPLHIQVSYEPSR